MGDRRCCCECYSYVDYFTEPHDDPYGPCRTSANGLTLGPKWRLISPAPPPDTWYVVSEDGHCYLYEEGNSGATIINTDRLPRGPLNDETSSPYSRFMSATITVKNLQVLDTYSILLDWVEENDSTTSYIELRYYQASISQAVLSFYSISHGVETLIKTCTIDQQISPGGSLVLYACNSGGVLVGTAAGQEMTAASVNVAENSSKPGWRAGIMHRQTREVYFHDWILQELIDDFSYCPGCSSCRCGGWTGEEYRPVLLPSRLLLTITRDDGCDVLEGATCILLRQSGCISDTIWRGAIAYPGNCGHRKGQYYGDAATALLFEFRCQTVGEFYLEGGWSTDSLVPADWELDTPLPAESVYGILGEAVAGCFMYVPTSTPLMSTYTFIRDESICDPLVAVFEFQRVEDNQDDQTQCTSLKNCSDECCAQCSELGERTVTYRMVVTSAY
jgi:hypothetical protein